MKLYTKQGDTGTTSLVGGTRVSKTDLRLEVYGSIDEVNAHLGLIRAIQGAQATEQLYLIQKTLFEVGFVFANDWSRFDPKGYIVTQDQVEQLEAEIDRLDASLPRLDAFVIPGGSMAAAQTHVARTVCRRTERLAVAFMELTQQMSESPVRKDVLGLEVAPDTPEIMAAIQCAIRYLNRLSDYLFVLARTL